MVSLLHAELEDNHDCAQGVHFFLSLFSELNSARTTAGSSMSATRLLAAQ